MSELLTDLELEAMDLSAKLANKVKEMIGSASPDWSEAALHIHGIQNMILSQAAARAYPDRFRLLGNSGTR